jgi:hypothetical protein
VTFESEQSVISVHSTSVVADSDKAAATVRQFDLNPRRARIEAILDQLLDNRRRSLHHLACGDAIDQVVGKQGAVERSRG